MSFSIEASTFLTTSWYFLDMSCSKSLLVDLKLPPDWRLIGLVGVTMGEMELGIVMEVVMGLVVERVEE